MSDWWSADPVAGGPSAPAAPSMRPIQRAFLNSMSAGESPDYNVIYGHTKERPNTFSDYSDHPRQNIPIGRGPNAGRTSSAAGKYQFLQGTWDEAKNALGLPDFSPESQDKAALWLAERDYKKKTGRSLWDDLEGAKDNPAKLNFHAGALGGTWTSLPGGIEPNSATHGFGQRMVSELSGQSRQPAQPTTQPAAGGLTRSIQPTGDWWANDPVAQPAQTATKEPRVGMVEAISRGARQGVTANFGDELSGLKAASGIPDVGYLGIIPEALQAGAGAARIGYDYLTGGDSATKAYETTRDKARADYKVAQEDRPYSTIGGNVLGGLAMPVGAMAQGATLPIRMLQGAGVGAAYGGLSGAGEGENLADRASRGTVGAGLGAVVGGVAPPLVEGAIQAGRAVLNPMITAVRGAINPQAEAGRRVSQALARDAQADPAAAGRLTGQEFSDTPSATIMDLGGETTRGLARSAANTSPEGRQVLNDTINPRFEGQANRVTDWLRETFNFPNASAQADAIKKTAKTVNDANYGRVMAQHPVVDVPSEITQRPVVAQAMKDAVSLAKNRGEKLEGPGQRNTILSGDGYHIADDVAEPAKTSLRYWDYVKKALDSRIEGMKRKGGIDELDSKQKADFGGLVDARNALVQHLDDVAPAYAEARRGAAAFFGAEDAVGAGQNFVAQNFAVPEVRKAMAKMTPTERLLFQDGFVSRYIETLEKVADRRSVINKIAETPAAREKLELALGKQKATELEAKLRIEGIMDLARGAVQGNSTTARQLAEIGMAGGTGAVGVSGIYNMDPNQAGIAAVSAALMAGRRGIDTRVAREVAKMLVSNDPAQLSRGLQIVTKNQRFMDNLRGADRRIAQVGGQESPKGLIPIQSMTAPRAEEQQPGVQGPRGQ
jgi:muramidase (phage lysozyme)